MNTMHVSKPILNVAPQVADNEIDLVNLLATLWRSKWWIILWSIIAIVAGGYYAFKVAIPKYPAQAVVALETKEQSIVDIESVISGAQGGSEEVNTEVEVLRSRVLISRLVDRLNLVDDPEFNITLREPNPYHPIVILTSYLGSERTYTNEQIYHKVIDNVLGAITVSNIRKSLVFRISAVTEDPVKSADIANTLAKLYIQDALDEKRKATEDASVWLSQKAAELKIELEASELAVTEFKETTQLVNEEALALLSRNLKDLRQKLLDLAERKEFFESKIASINIAIASGNRATIAAVADDSRLVRFAEQDNRTGFDLRLQTVLRQAQVEIDRTDQQLKNLQKSEEDFTKEIETQSMDLVRLQQLAREADANGLLYESFLTRLKETSVQKGLQRPDSRLLSSAVPRPASSPRVAMMLVISAMIGGMLGCGLVLIRELVDKAFRSAEDLEAFTGYKVLGTIPSIKTRTRLGVLDYAIRKPTSAFAEAVRNLRTSVLLSDPHNEPKMIMSTSSVPGEGKTTQSLSLAQNIAGLNKRVLVLEGDVRKQIFSQYFDVPGKKGFMAVMSGEIELEDAIHTHDGMGIDLLFGEKSRVNAADVFASSQFKQLLETLREKYDYIVVDTAPVLAVSDARIIGRYVDAVIYSVLWNKTTKNQVRDGLAMFTSVGVPVTGLVLSNVNLRKLKRYGEAGSYEYTGYYDN